MKAIAIFTIRIYRVLCAPLISTFFGPWGGCRFSPSCSQYAEEAIHRYGFLKGVSVTLHRILRCNPLSLGGYDPVR